MYLLKIKFNIWDKNKLIIRISYSVTATVNFVFKKRKLVTRKKCLIIKIVHKKLRKLTCVYIIQDLRIGILPLSFPGTRCAGFNLFRVPLSFPGTRWFIDRA